VATSKGLETAKLIVATFDGIKKEYSTFAPLQPLQTIYTLQGLQKSHPGAGELTSEEKQTFVKHWLDRSKPTLTKGQVRWFNLTHLETARSQYRPNQTMDFCVEPQKGDDDFSVSLALVTEAARDFSPRAARGGLRDD
jgi:hypothetical protein